MKYLVLCLLLVSCAADVPVNEHPPDAWELSVYHDIAHQYERVYGPFKMSGKCSPSAVTMYDVTDPAFWGYYYNDGTAYVGINPVVWNTPQEEATLAHEWLHHILLCTTGSVDGGHSGYAWDMLDSWEDTRCKHAEATE